QRFRCDLIEAAAGIGALTRRSPVLRSVSAATSLKPIDLRFLGYVPLGRSSQRFRCDLIEATGFDFVCHVLDASSSQRFRCDLIEALRRGTSTMATIMFFAAFPLRPH